MGVAHRVSLSLRGGTAQEEAGGASPGKGFDFITRLYSLPIAERWRLVAGWEYYQADVTEGLAQRYREGVGFEWRLPDFTLEAIFWYNHGSLAKPGGLSSVAGLSPRSRSMALPANSRNCSKG